MSGNVVTDEEFYKSLEDRCKALKRFENKCNYECRKERDKQNAFGGVWRPFKITVYCPKVVDGSKRGWVVADIFCQGCEHCEEWNLDNLGVWCSYPTKKLQQMLKSTSESSKNCSVKAEGS